MTPRVSRPRPDPMAMLRGVRSTGNTRLPAFASTVGLALETAAWGLDNDRPWPQHCFAWAGRRKYRDRLARIKFPS